MSSGEREGLGDGGPAFPVPMGHVDKGMSLRDYFAGLAMQAIVAKAPHERRESPASHKASIQKADEISMGAYRYADAMLAARKAVTP